MQPTDQPTCAAPEVQAVKRTFDHPVMIGVGLIVALLVINASLTYRNTRQLNERARWVADTHVVLNSTADVMLTLVDAETGTRGFVITGKDEFLQPYDAALVRFDGLMAKLKDKTKDNSGQQARITKLEEMTAVRLDQMKEVIDLRRKDEKAAQAFVLTGKPMAQMDAIRQHVAEMVKVEDDLLKERESMTATTYQIAVTTGLLTTILGLITVGAFVWLLWRSLAARQQAAAVLYEQREWFRLTLASIGDGVIATDTEGKVTFLNAVAQSLTGWTEAEARGTPLETVFNIVNEETRKTVENPALRALKEGRIMGLANHTFLISKSGQDCPIDDSAAPIRNEEGNITGAVLVFRDVSERRRAEEGLRESEARKSAMLNSALDAIVTMDHEGKVVDFNPAAESTFGYQREEAVGKPMDQLIIPPPDRERHRRGLAQYLVTGEGPVLGKRLELPARRADGSEFPVELTITRMPSVGSPMFTGFIRDITERKRAEDALHESEQRYRAATAAVSDLIWTNNADGVMKGEQRDWGKFTGQSYEEYQGYGWSKAVHPEDVQPTIEAWNRAVAEKRTFEFEHRVHRRDGEWRICSIRAVPVLDADGTIREWVGVHTDITKRKRDEEKLRQLAADLSEAHHRKDEFLATLAHELRNPLAPLRNGLELMKLAGGQEASIEEARSMMERQLAQMVRLVDDLMDVSRISRGKIELKKERVQLAAVVNSAVETSRPLIKQMGHKLTVTLPEQPLIVDADLTRLAQVFLNLLNNAAKYSERGGHITLAVERQGSDVLVSVKDTGIGIAADQLPRIFEMFTQVDRALEKSQGGLGIGLSLVKRLAEMHEGRVEAKSEGPGKGSEFVVRLPVVVEASKPPESGGAAEQPAKSSLRILVVDDNRDGANTLSMMLNILGNDTRTAYDGQQGVDVAEEYRPDVILLDIGLPKLNGYEACRRIREQSWGKDVVMIAATGWGQDDDRRRSQEAGFDHHLVKPVAPQTLMKILAGLDVGHK